MENFQYHEPSSVVAAVALLGQHRGEAKVLAGGQSLVLMLHDRLLNPAHLVSLQGIAELRGIRHAGDGGLCIGAMTTLRELEQSPTLRQQYPVLSDAAGRIASVHIRHLGTLGGNLCHSLVGADLPPVILALGAGLRVAGPDGQRVVPAAAFFRGFMETAVAEDELLVGVEIPPPAPGTRAAYLKHCVRPVDPAIVGVAAALRLHGDRLADVRLGIGGAGLVPVRAVQAEAVLRDRVPSDDLLAEAGAVARRSVDCLDDAHASAGYRSRMVAVSLRRAVRAALSTANHSTDKGT